MDVKTKNFFGKLYQTSTDFDSQEMEITVNVTKSKNGENKTYFVENGAAQDENLHDPALILPTDLEIYTQKVFSHKIEKENELETNPSFECRRNCGKHFKTLTERALHEMHEHKRKERRIKCNFCNETFEGFFALTRHMAKHRNNHRYICSHCSNCFDSYSALQDHWKSSTSCNAGDEDNKNKTENIKTEEFTTSPPIEPKSAPIEQVTPPIFAFLDNTKSNLGLLKTQNLKRELVPEMSSIEKKPLSFAEEVKAFAAKYQLKTVAKKRTSALPPRSMKNSTNAYQYMPSFQNIRIKKEPIDDDEFVNHLDTNDTDQIQIKNEPYDECENYTNDWEPNLNMQNSIPTNLVEFKNASKNLDEILQKNQKTADILNKPKELMGRGTTLSEPHKRKILLNTANLCKMKNVKIYKLDSHGKVVQFSLPTNQLSLKKEPTEKSNESSLETSPVYNCANIIKLEKPDGPTTMPRVVQIEKFIDTLNSDLQCSDDNISKEDNDTKKKLLAELEKMVKDNEKTKRTTSLPRSFLRYMEEKPQVQKVIEDLQRQFQNATEQMVNKPDKNENSDKKLLNLENETTTKCIPSLSPVSFFVKVTDPCDKQLMIARRQHYDHYYVWLCPLCEREYKMKHALISHLVGSHKISVEQLKSLTVQVKPRKTAAKPEQNISSTQKRVDDLKSEPHCTVIAEYKCSVCLKAFSTKSTLTCHMTIHTGELPHQCNYCEKRFRTRGQKKVHHRTHTGEKPFQCPVCTQSFTHRETLITHLSSRHMDIKRYRCYCCQQLFSCIGGLRQHRLNRPNTCGLVPLDTRAIGPRIRVTAGHVYFEPQPVNNTYLRKRNFDILTEIQNI